MADKSSSEICLPSSSSNRLEMVARINLKSIFSGFTPNMRLIPISDSRLHILFNDGTIRYRFPHTLMRLYGIVCTSLRRCESRCAGWFERNWRSNYVINSHRDTYAGDDNTDSNSVGCCAMRNREYRSACFSEVCK